MDKSKNKRENPFADYLWQTEELLWMGRPSAQAWHYIGLMPIPRRVLDMFTVVYSIAFALGFYIFMVSVSATGIENLSLFFWGLLIPCLLPIMYLLSYPVLYSRKEIAYAITNRRILVLMNSQFREMQHELILTAGIKQVQHYESVIWDEGQVGFFPPFVGVEDAEYLVHLVEQARGENIPIVQKYWRDTIIYD